LLTEARSGIHSREASGVPRERGAAPPCSVLVARRVHLASAESGLETPGQHVPQGLLNGRPFSVEALHHRVRLVLREPRRVLDSSRPRRHSRSAEEAAVPSKGMCDPPSRRRVAPMEGVPQRRQATRDGVEEGGDDLLHEAVTARGLEGRQGLETSRVENRGSIGKAFPIHRVVLPKSADLAC